MAISERTRKLLWARAHDPTLSSAGVATSVRGNALKAAVWFATGIALILGGYWVSTWESNWHAGSVWSYMDQVNVTTSSWSREAIAANIEYVTAAGILVLAGTASLAIAATYAVSALRSRSSAAPDRSGS